MQTIFDALRPGAVILHSDEELGILWVWYGGSNVNIVDPASGEDIDCFGWCEKPADHKEALQWAKERVQRLEEELEDESEGWDRDDEDATDDWSGWLVPDERDE